MKPGNKPAAGVFAVSRDGIHFPEELPISAHAEEIISAIRQNQVLVVAGDTGSGKTTQLPKMCLAAGRGHTGFIGCTQPRRIAAVSVAERVAQELGPQQAHLVGYKIRFSDRTTRSTRIKFMTDGMLLAEAQGDRYLRAYETIIIDEAHERSLNIDFLLGLVKMLVTRRNDLQVIITSATIDTEKFSRHFDNAPIIEVSGRAYPVEVRYQPLDSDDEEEGGEGYVDRAVAAVTEIRAEDRTGDILIFMPTERDIRETCETLEQLLNRSGSKDKGRGAIILPLFGRLSPADQKKIFRTFTQQKIVVATNVAETSVTVPGIRYVIDTGLARVSLYNPRARNTKMPIVPISQASCEQRKGRCGRVGPGICIRLYAEDDFDSRTEFTQPEILRANLAEVILQMLSLRLGEPDKFPFVDPPSARAVKDGYALLGELGAIDSQRKLTATGWLISRLPLDPTLARMLIEARENNALREVAIIASGLSIQDPRVRPADQEADADREHAALLNPESDFLTLLTIWDAYHSTFENLQRQSRMRKFCRQKFISYLRMREWSDIYDQVCQVLAEEEGFVMNVQPADYAAVHRSLLSGNLRNIAVRKEKGGYQAAGGRDVVIFPGSALQKRGGRWLMAAELVETTRLFARTVAIIDPEWIEPLATGLCSRTYSDPHWEKKRGQVVAFETVSLFGLVIVPRRRVNFSRIDPEQARQIFIQQGLMEGDLRGDYEFLEHNRQLLNRLQEIEDRVRKRDVVVDEQTIYSFYEQRLPDTVHDQRGLNQLIKKKDGDRFLRMAEADVLHRLPGEDQLEQFPDMLEFDGITVQLIYRFNPGAEDDGVNVMIPYNLLAHLPREPFEWLVPGMLADKVAFLLKGLPKQFRRVMVPVPAAAEKILASLTPYKGSLYRALEDVISKLFHVRVLPQHWPEELPPHFLARFCAVDGQGKVVKASRNVDDFSGTDLSAAAKDDDRIKLLKEDWRRPIESFSDLGDIPLRLPLTDMHENICGFVCPALVVDGEKGVALELLDDPEEAEAMNRKGLMFLFRREFSQHVKPLRKDFCLKKNQWSLCEGICSLEEMNTMILEFILAELFGTIDGVIPEAAVLEKKIAELRETGIYAQSAVLFEEIVNVLVDRRKVLEEIRLFSAKGGFYEQCAIQFTEHLRSIVPRDFLAVTGRSDLLQIRRYLKALMIRLERAKVDPNKDAAKAERIAPFEKRLLELSGVRPQTAEQRRLADDFFQMVAEFRISLFAQEMRTAFPVSEKRLEEKWRELILSGAVKKV